MNRTARGRAETVILDLEVAWVVLLAAAIFVSVPLSLGKIGLAWDTLNHHIYLGWVADHARFDKDFLAAGGQATQFPYLYWPLYKLALAGFSGMAAGAVLALLHVLAVPPVWLVSRSLMPGGDFTAAALRLCAVLLAFMSAVPLKTLESTHNDFLAAIPLLWAIALVLLTTDEAAAHRRPHGQLLLAAIAGVLGGLAVACKLSNGPLVAILPIALLFAHGSWRLRAKLFTLCCATALAGFVAGYGYWGWEHWRMFGNPVFPFYDGHFARLRDIMGWTR